MKKLLFFAFLAGIMASCQKDSLDLVPVPGNSDESQIIATRTPDKPRAFNMDVTWMTMLMDDGVACTPEPGETSSVRKGYKLSGKAGHMGHITGYWFTCVQLPSGNCTNGSGTLMSANWNNVSYTFESMEIVRTEYPYMYFEGRAVITGGTGRYEGATGWFYVEGYKSMEAGPYEAGGFAADGEIMY